MGKRYPENIEYFENHYFDFCRDLFQVFQVSLPEEAGRNLHSAADQVIEENPTLRRYLNDRYPDCSPKSRLIQDIYKAAYSRKVSS